MKLPNIYTGDTTKPIYTPSATELAFAANANLLVWLEGDTGFTTASGTKWHGRKSGKPFAVTGTALAAGTSANGNGTRTFVEDTNVAVPSGIPASGDYSMFAVINVKKTTAQSTSCHWLGSPSGSVYFAFGAQIQTGSTNFRMNVSQNGVPSITGTVDHPTNAVCLVSVYWDQTTGTHRTYFNGVLEATSTAGRTSNTETTLWVGDVGLAGARGMIGDIGAVMVFNVDCNKAANAALAATVISYLKTKYGIA